MSKPKVPGLVTLLRDILKVLNKVDEEHFNLSSWLSLSHAEEAFNLFTSGKTKLAMKECGATACALGWCCIDPKFSGKYNMRLDRCHVPVCDGRDQWAGVRELLSRVIGSESAYQYGLELYLFLDTTYVDKSLGAVKDRITSLILYLSGNQGVNLLANMPDNTKSPVGVELHFYREPFLEYMGELRP